MELFNMLNLCIDNEDVTFVINQNIARHYIPNLVLAVSETPIFGSLFKTKGCHIGVNHNLCGRVRIGDSWLNNNRLDSATIESCKAVERISGIWEKNVVHQNLVQQANDASTIKQIVDFINDFFANIGVIFVTAGTRYAKVKNIHYGNPKTLVLRHLFSDTLLCFETTYILEAISTLRFMYCAKSLELIGDCCDAAIFRILRSVTSLWNWLRNIMIHSYLCYFRCKIKHNFRIIQLIVNKNHKKY